MQRVTLVHWKAEEAQPLVDRLRGLGYAVALHGQPDGHARLREDPPAAFVIDLGRLPSHGRELGGWLRRQKDTRAAVLVFVGGKAEAVARTRALLPDASYTDWDAIEADLAEALAHARGRPALGGLAHGLVDYKVCAIDATWSGLCFARRGAVRRRPGLSRR